MNYRTVDPLYYGFILDGPEANLCVVAALSLFGLCFLASKLVAVAALGSASLVGLLLFFAAESTAFLLVRMALKTWRFGFKMVGENTVLMLTRT